MKNVHSNVLITVILTATMALGVACEKNEGPQSEATPAEESAAAESEPAPSAGERNAPSPDDSPTANKEKPSSPGAVDQRAPKQRAPGAAQGDQEAANQPGTAKRQPGQMQGAPDQKITDEQIDKYVEASGNMNEHNKELQRKMGSVSDPEEAKKLQREAREKMKSELEEVGLAPPVYVAIGKKMKADPGFRQRVQEIAKESAN
ncbi:MAG: DUF4168 domain-containing protein [Myxococcota bacterium]